MRVLVDTNILISAALSSNGTPYMERFLDEKGLYEEAREYIMKCILDREDLPFD